MLAASLVGIFMIPMLYVVFQTLRERVKRRTGGHRIDSDAGPGGG